MRFLLLPVTLTIACADPRFGDDASTNLEDISENNDFTLDITIRQNQPTKESKLPPVPILDVLTVSYTTSELDLEWMELEIPLDDLIDGDDRYWHVSGVMTIPNAPDQGWVAIKVWHDAVRELRLGDQNSRGETNIQHPEDLFPANAKGKTISWTDYPNSDLDSATLNFSDARDDPYKQTVDLFPFIGRDPERYYDPTCWTEHVLNDDDSVTLIFNWKTVSVSLATKLRMTEIGERIDAYLSLGHRMPKTEGLTEVFGKAKVPKDGWGNPFILEPKGSRYDLISYGADGVEGGTDNDADIRLSEMR